MAKSAKPVVVSGPSFGVAVAAFVAAVTAVAVSPYTPIAASTQDALTEASEQLILAAGNLSGGASADPADLQPALEKAVGIVFDAHRESLIGAVVAKLQPELQDGLDGLKSSLPAAIETALEAYKPALIDTIKAQVAAQIPPARTAGG